MSIAELAETSNQTVIVAGLITAVRSILTKNNNHLAVITIEDTTGNIEAVVFADLYAKKRDILLKDQLIVLEGDTDIDNFSGNTRFKAKAIMNLEEARSKYADCLMLKLQKNLIDQTMVDKMLQLFKPYIGGNCPICINYYDAKDNTKILLGNDWRVHLKNQLLEDLATFLGKDHVKVQYRNK